jgi:hypothetical protein
LVFQLKTIIIFLWSVKKCGDKMRIRFSKIVWLFLVVTSLAACQGPTALSNNATPSINSVTLKPGGTSSPIVNTIAPYPLINETVFPLQESKTAPYPPPLFSVTPFAGPTYSSTPIPTIQQPTQIFELPTSPPLPEYTQSINYYYPKCAQQDLYIQCEDKQLGIQFKYPSRWGIIYSELVNGTCGGYAYGFYFNAAGFEVKSGGVSLDYCKPIGADLYSLFHGFPPNQGCSLFPKAQDCRQINENVVIATIYPDFRSICVPGPGSITNPVMLIGINIPGKHPVAGLVFAIDFLSIKGKDQLFEPFGGAFFNTEKCGEPNTEQAYNQLVKDISSKVRAGTLDEETSYKIKGITVFANSIILTP